MATITEKTVYCTEDGKEFDTLEEAEQWDWRLLVAEKFRRYAQRELSREAEWEHEAIVGWFFDNFTLIVKR